MPGQSSRESLRARLWTNNWGWAVVRAHQPASKRRYGRQKNADVPADALAHAHSRFPATFLEAFAP